MKKINGSNPFGEKKGKTNKSKNAIGREKAHILCSLMRIFVGLQLFRLSGRRLTAAYIRGNVRDKPEGYLEPDNPRPPVDLAHQLHQRLGCMQ